MENVVRENGRNGDLELDALVNAQPHGEPTAVAASDTQGDLS